MVSDATASCFPNVPQNLQMYSEDVAVAGSETHSSSLLYYLSNLKDKVQQIQSLVSVIISPDHQNQESTSIAIAIASMGNLIPEIIVSASSMMFTCQQMSLTVSTDGLHQQQQHVKVPDSGLPQHHSGSNNNIIQERSAHGFYSAETMDWYGDQDNHNSCYTNEINNNHSVHQVSNKRPKVVSMKDYDIVELDAADLLAKYTHYCQVCGKGFKRDANLRMHMRAHGDEYKTSAALSNPMKNIDANSNTSNGNMMKLGRKFSCPQEGCRWNKKHAKFQPLKSMICVKNHYKRSHCPKMYVCKRCNQKQFSVLSDLRTHEKHCGDLKWQCSCGTTFSRKDKLMGHVALFIGHTPAINSMTKLNKIELQAAQTQLDDRG